MLPLIEVHDCGQFISASAGTEVIESEVSLAVPICDRPSGVVVSGHTARLVEDEYREVLRVAAPRDCWQLNRGSALGSCGGHVALDRVRLNLKPHDLVQLDRARLPPM